MIAPTAGGVLIDIRVVPRAKRSAIAGQRGDAVLVRLQAPPVDGAANAELVEVLSAALGVTRRDVSIVSGEHARQKRVRVAGIDVETAAARLGKAGTLSPD